MPTALEQIKEIIDKLAESGSENIRSVVNDWRRNVVLMIAESEPLDALSVETLKVRLNALSQQVEAELSGVLSDNQRRLFVKGIQTVDRIINEKGIRHALPFISEKKLDLLQKYSAEQIRGLTDNATRSISTEIDLAVLGQKSASEVIANIGKNLDDPSIFGTVAKRAQVIFQTEVKRIQNISTHDRIIQAKQQVGDMGKKWIHSHVGVPRPGHLMLDGVIIPADEQFELVGADGEIYYVDHPHDPDLPAGEVINCRCQIVPVVMRFEQQRIAAAYGRQTAVLQRLLLRLEPDNIQREAEELFKAQFREPLVEFLEKVWKNKIGY